MSKIDLKWTDRKIGKAQTPRRFLDFFVDGKSIYELLETDLITPLGWFSADENQKVINRLLTIGPPDFSDNRSSIYICPECGDLGCGAVSAIIERAGEQIIWRDFGYQNNYDDSVIFDGYREVGPFSFDVGEYTRTIQQATEHNS